MDSIATQIRSLVQSADEAGRLEIQKALRDIQLEIQNPKDVIMEIGNSNTLVGVTRLGADLGLFRHLASHDGSLTVDQMAGLTPASPQLLERILRCLASNSLIKEVGVNEYQANNTTHILASPNTEAAVYHIFDMNGPSVMAMPEFFAENKYQDLDSVTNTPFQKAQNTTLSAFDWLVQKPELFSYLQKVMTLVEGSEWTVGFALLDSEIQKIPSGPPKASEKPFFVDVGGGHGHQCIQLGKKYPNLLGRLVLQDLPTIVDKLPPIEGVKIQSHDFFKKQPISGAKFYYLRRIMHDWPDKECAQILQNIVDVMDPDSRILIDDTVIPDTGATWQSTMADISMMITLAGKERTNQQWRALAGRVGLRVEEIHSYTASTYTSVVVLSLK